MVRHLPGPRHGETHAARPPRHTLRYLVVDPGPVLADRIATRVDRMLADGWRDEVAALSERVPDEATAWKASGYEALRRHLRGELTLEEARALIVIETRQYAKRQRTWFRHQLLEGDVTRHDPTAPGSADRLRAWWEGGAA